MEHSPSTQGRRRMSLRRRLLIPGILLLWLVTMAWLVRYEAFPARFTHTIEGYKDVLRGGELFADSWVRILFRGSPIGYSHSSVEILEDNPMQHYRIGTRTLLQMNLMGEVQHISVIANAGLDVLQQLQSFDFTLTSRRYSLKIEARRRQGDEFSVLIRSPTGNRSTRVEIPKDVVIYSPMTDLALKQLKPGGQIRLRTLDPASMTVADVFVRALREETIRVGTNDYAATALQLDYQGMRMNSWIDREGKVLRQDTPLGWTLERATAEEAMRIDLNPADAQDMLAASAVPVEGTIRYPETSGEVVVELTGLPTSFEIPEDIAQSLLSRTGDVVVIRARRSDWPAAPTSHGSDTNLTRYLASSSFIQADDERIRAQARRLTEGLGTDRAKAEAIFDWVYKSVEKTPTVSLPSAVDVLAQLEGDCNEHTYLFTALARSVGIPTQVRIGLVYKDNSYYYHAWPAVFVGEWVAMDPTSGEERVGPGHLWLLEGELADQLKLMSVFGRVSAKVISESP